MTEVELAIKLLLGRTCDICDNFGPKKKMCFRDTETIYEMNWQPLDSRGTCEDWEINEG